MQPQPQYAKLTFSNYKKPGDGTCSLAEAWKHFEKNYPDHAWSKIDLSSPEAQEFMREVVEEFEGRARAEAHREADDHAAMNGDPRLKDRNLHGRAAANLFEAKTSDFANVTKGVVSIVLEKAKHDELPRGVFPKMDAELDKQREQQLAAGQAKKDEIRDNAIVNAAIDEKIAERMQSADIGRAQAMGELRAEGVIPGKKASVEERAAWHREQVEGPQDEQAQEQAQEQGIEVIGKDDDSSMQM